MSPYPQPLPEPKRYPCELCGLGVPAGQRIERQVFRSACVYQSYLVCSVCRAQLDRVVADEADILKDSRKGEELT